MSIPRSSSSSSAELKPFPGSNRVWVGASAGLMYFWCMLLPLVGKAGSRSPQNRVNFYTVLAVLLLALLCTAMAGWQMRKRKTHPGRTCWGWRGCLGVQILLLLFLLSGAFGV